MQDDITTFKQNKYSYHNIYDYHPRLLVNSKARKMKISNELNFLLYNCDSFSISVAFIAKSGLAVLKQCLLELEKRDIPGRIVTSTYLNFNAPKMFEELLNFKNLEVRIYNENNSGFHPKGYIFKSGNVYHALIGSTNLTQSALSTNQEWNLLINSPEEKEIILEIQREFDDQWECSIPLTSAWINAYKEIYLPPRKNHVTKEKKNIVPNKMQEEALSALQQIRDNGGQKALIISATGTGKTYLSAFDVKKFKPKKMLFVVHRENIARTAMESFQKLIPNKSMTFFSGKNISNVNSDYIFTTIQTIHKDKYLSLFNQNTFDYIIIDEVHRAGAASYQRIFKYFIPQFFLGMSATPERSDDIDIAKMFDYNIAYEIRLSQALEFDLLCPFHYYGITDITIDGIQIDDKTEFNKLVSNKRVDYIIDKINKYSYSGERLRGLVFCSRKEEAHELSTLFNQRGFKTLALTGEDSEKKRRETMDLLETNDPNNYIDYIFTVDIFNEGIDIPKVNQIIMLRPTQSSIIFIQQLGRGLRKDASKEYVVVLDFIGNYSNNFLIPIALSSDSTYNKDNLRKFMEEGSLLTPGCTTISFDEISKKQIFNSIDKVNFNSIKLLKENYFSLKAKLGRIPALTDFIIHDSIDPAKFFQNPSLKSYHAFLSKYEPTYNIQFDSYQENCLKYISTKLANGKRIHEIEALKICIEKQHNILKNLEEKLELEYEISVSPITYTTIINMLTQNFISGSAKETYKDIIFIKKDRNEYAISTEFLTALDNPDFKKQILELIEYAIYKYKTDYTPQYKNTSLCLYQKYNYEDVCRLLDWQKNIVPQNIGGYKYDDATNTLPVFVNYKKDDKTKDSHKYNDRFLNPSTFIAMGRGGEKLSSKRIQYFNEAEHKKTSIHLFIRKNKNDANSKEFYYLGITHIKAIKSTVMNHTKQNICEIIHELETPVRKDIYDYLTK